MRLVDLVRIDHRFEKSVNLLLDLNDESKLKLYIPTRSSIKLLTEYLEEVDTFSGKRANILIGEPFASDAACNPVWRSYGRTGIPAEPDQYDGQQSEGGNRKSLS